jgi:hypothetical protein
VFSSYPNEKGIERGCGTRVKGGIYAETVGSPHGHPIECFIKDSPIPIDADKYGLSSIGVKLIRQKGVVYIFDIVGSEHYPWVSDFVEEARRYGVSRRLPPNLPWEELSVDSKLVLLHKNAVFEDVEVFRNDMNYLGLDGSFRQKPQMCPQEMSNLHCGKPLQLHTTAGCGRFWWHDHDAEPDQPYHRQLPSLTYDAVGRPGPTKTKLGIFMVVPVGRIVVINDPEMKSHEKHLLKILDSLKDIPVELEDA